MLVAELGDQVELVIELRAHAVGCARGPAIAFAAACEFAQLGSGVAAVRHKFGWVGVVQLAQREAAAVGQFGGAREGCRRVERLQRRERAQVAFAVGVQRAARVLEGAAEPDAGHCVLQGAARAAVHADVAGGDQSEGAAAGDDLEGAQVASVVRAAVQGEGEGGVAECLATPTREATDRAQVRCGLLAEVGRHQQCRTPGGVAGEVVLAQGVAALFGTAPPAGDQPAEVAVAGVVAREQHQAAAVIQRELGADDEPQAVLLRGFQRADDARE